MLHERPSKSASHNPAIGPAPSITTPLPGPIAKSLIDRDERYSSPSYTRDYPLVVNARMASSWKMWTAIASSTSPPESRSAPPGIVIPTSSPPSRSRHAN